MSNRIEAEDDIRKGFRKTIQDDSIKSHIQLAKRFKDWVLEKNDKVLKEMDETNFIDILAWDINSENYVVSSKFVNDECFSTFLVWCWNLAEKKHISIYNLCRKAHSYLAHVIKKIGLKGFLAVGSNEASVWPRTEEVWKSMKIKDEFVYHDSVKENQILTLEEDAKVSNRLVDMSSPADVQMQLIFHLNVSSACRPGTMKNLDSTVTKSWEIEEDGITRKRAYAKSFKFKTNPQGAPKAEKEKQTFRLVCECKLGSDHNQENAMCPVALLDKHLENLQKSDIESEKKIITLEAKLQKQKKRSPPAQKAILKTEKSLSSIKQLFNQKSLTPLLRRGLFKKDENGELLSIGFHPCAGNSIYNHTKEMIQKEIDRPFTYYDGRKTSCNKLTYEAPKIGIHLDPKEIADNITHNQVKTMQKHYINHDPARFKATEAFALVRAAHKVGLNEKLQPVSFMHQKRALMNQNLPPRKRLKQAEKENLLLKNEEIFQNEEANQDDLLTQIVNYEAKPNSPTQMTQINVKQNIVQNLGSNGCTQQLQSFVSQQNQFQQQMFQQQQQMFQQQNNLQQQMIQQQNNFQKQLMNMFGKTNPK